MKYCAQQRREFLGQFLSQSGEVDKLNHCAMLAYGGANECAGGAPAPIAVGNGRATNDGGQGNRQRKRSAGVSAAGSEFELDTQRKLIGVRKNAGTQGVAGEVAIARILGPHA